jgi:hypothetical protein
MFRGRWNASDFLLGVLARTLFENTVGGVALPAIVNHAPVAHDIAANRQQDADSDED